MTSPLTFTINADTASAQKALTGIGDSFGKLGESAEGAGEQFEILSSALGQIDKDVSKGEGMAELNARLETLKDEVIEFGGTVDDMRTALNAVGVEAARTGKPVALVSNAMRKLVDESEDAAKAAAYLPQAMALAERAMIKTEDAGALMGRALKGDTAALKALGGVSEDVAKQIDKITDPARRQAAILRELDRQLGATGGASTRLGSALGTLQNKIADVNARLAGMGVPGLTVQNMLGGLAVAAGAAAVAIGTKLVEAQERYIASSRSASEAAKKHTDAMEKLEISIGKTYDAVLGGEKADREWAARTEIVNERLAATQKQMEGNEDKAYDLAYTIENPLASAMLRWQSQIDWATKSLDDFLGISDDIEQKLLVDQRATLKANATAWGNWADDIGTAWNNLTNEGNKLLDTMDYIKAAEAAKAAKGGIKDQGKTSQKAGRKRGGGGGRRRKTKEDTRAMEEALRRELLLLTQTAAAHNAIAQNRGREMAKRLEDQAKLRTRIAKISADFTALGNQGLDLIHALERAQRELLAAQIERTGDAINSVLQGVTQSAYGLVDALASGTLALKDLGAASAMAGGDIIAGLGLDIVSKAVGAFAQKLGSVFVGVGAGFEALASNPLALLGIGAGLIAAGALLKNFGAKSMSGATPSKARSADASAANAVQALGRNLFAEQDREERTFNLVIGDWGTVRGAVRDMASTTGTTAHYQRELT